MNSFFGRLRSHRLASTFTILATLSIGILIGSAVSHGVKGKEQQVDSSDAKPLQVPNPQVLSNTFSTIAKQVEPAVVNINTESLPKEDLHKRRPRTRANPDQGNGDDQDGNGGGSAGNGDDPMQDFFNRFFGGQNPEDGGGDGGARASLGSGFIVDPRGYILTNNHVVDKADRIFVKLPSDPEGDVGRPAKVIGVDKATDIAVIKIDTKEPLPTVKLGNSESSEVGDWVLAIGSPFGLQQTVTAGIVSSKNRDITPGVGGQFQRFIQTDAAINPGNSGGPLVNMNGEVIGVNTAIYTQSMGYQGVGFAMPSNTVVNTYNQLIGPEHKVVRGSIGISFQPNLPTAVARMYGFKNGVLISGVDTAQPADKAGLKSGDIIVSIDGRSIKDGDDLVADISARKPGSSIKVGYLRSGKQESATIAIGDREKVLAARASAGGPDENDSGDQDQNAAPGKIGVTVRAIPSNIASKLGIKGGVQVMQVRPGSFAEEVSLTPGQIIVEVNKKPIQNEQDFRAIVAGFKSGDDVVFTVRSPQGADGGVNYLGGTLP